RFWQARHPPRYAAFLTPSSPRFRHSSRQLAYLQKMGVKFDRRIDHGMTHSLYLHDPNGYGVELVYELPREVWEGDIDAALNFAEVRPHEGAELLVDRTDVPVFGTQSRPSN
ncbi:VOC family protein, partial [Bradyrhizobium diazoefficiens]